MEEECKGVNLENLNDNLIGFLFFLDSWHDFFKVEQKKILENLLILRNFQILK